MVICGSSRRSLENPLARNPSPVSVSKYKVEHVVEHEAGRAQAGVRGAYGGDLLPPGLVGEHSQPPRHGPVRNRGSSISDGEPSLPPSWPEPSPGTTVSIGLYLPGRRANAGHCLRLNSVTGKVHPHPGHPQVSSIAPGKWPKSGEIGR